MLGRRDDPAAASPADEELMARIAGGCRESVAELHRRHASLIEAIVRRSLGREAAEEIVQDVFVAAWRKAASFDPARGTFRTWILRIAHHRVLNELRRRGRRPRIARDADESHLGNAPEHRPGPEEAAWHAHRTAFVRDAVAALPPTQRQALALAFAGELTHEEVARSLGLPLGTAKSRIRSGMQALRVRLAPLVAAGLAVLVTLSVALVREATSRAAIRRQEAALRLVTSSDVVPLRLAPTPGSAAPPEAHGNYRGRRGAEIAVLTLSKLPPAPEGYAYCAWGLFDGRWHRLGTAVLDTEGHALLISEGPHLAAPPGALKVTLESSSGSASPTGPTAISWPAP
ncbi:ECF RNA polymerase sigma factor RpoE [Aquisphaera giovannonii]|uniref:RNA polymerase sigma factor n=1 Tax=Aquisphaera giovannonii TaxID=406548 RepID=A0A5B9VYI0_9BACT|nr:sigma-70 family RNA polymerase sigma factor [Aquisphaera giovannonii]QEH33403.1 ECF RNA polymerase sigma factor RpoE [Aquisphaera giovannonii]